MLNPIKAKALFFLFVLELLISPPKHRAWNVASYPCPLKTFSNKINHKQSVQQENRNRELNSKCMRKCLSIIREHHFDALREIMHSLNDRVYLLLLIKTLKMVCQSIPNFSISFLGSFLLVSGRNFTSMVFPMRSFWILRLRTLKFSLSGWCGFLLFGLCCLQSRNKESAHFFFFSQAQPDTNLCAALTSINFSWQPSQASLGCVSSRHALWWCPFSPFDFEEKKRGGM